ncbi:MAG: hypothetical protein JWN40_4742 [Phycisphaerales bacterium]|nr:hypothetical protein [Phycisphaerales bacterium]
MPRVLSALLIIVLALGLVVPALAKKHPTTATAPATQEAPKGKEDAVATHKHRAAEFENGKELDAEKTKGKVGTLSDQVNALDKKLKDSGKGAAEEAPATGKRHHAAATQPATQEAPKSSKTKARREAAEKAAAESGK